MEQNAPLVRAKLLLFCLGRAHDSPKRHYAHISVTVVCEWAKTGEKTNCAKYDKKENKKQVVRKNNRETQNLNNSFAF
jgi:hypothetical protein